MKKFRLLITGSRDWDHYESIKENIIKVISDYIADNPQMRTVPLNSWFNILHGNCPRGTDMLADHFVRTVLGIEPEIYEADWRIGKKAGPLRNMRMVDSMPDACLVFLRPNPKHKGTEGCRDYAKKKGIPTETIRYEDVANGISES